MEHNHISNDTGKSEVRQVKPQASPTGYMRVSTLTLFLDASAINSWILRAFACSLIEYQKQQRHKNNLFLGQLNLVLNNPSQKQDISFLIEQVWVFVVVVVHLRFVLFLLLFSNFIPYVLQWRHKEMGPQSLTHSLLMRLHHCW